MIERLTPNGTMTPRRQRSAWITLATLIVLAFYVPACMAWQPVNQATIEHPGGETLGTTRVHVDSGDEVVMRDTRVAYPVMTGRTPAGTPVQLDVRHVRSVEAHRITPIGITGIVLGGIAATFTTMLFIGAVICAAENCLSGG
jgi:hypothetical protein